MIKSGILFWVNSVCKVINEEVVFLWVFVKAIVSRVVEKERQTVKIS